jgi:hypothetical protein
VQGIGYLRECLNAVKVENTDTYSYPPFHFTRKELKTPLTDLNPLLGVKQNMQLGFNKSNKLAKTIFQKKECLKSNISDTSYT